MTHIFKVSEVQFVPVKPDNGLVGFASCILDDCYYVGSIAIFTRLSGGYRLVFPTKKVGDRHLHHHHPITKEMSKAMEEAILSRAAEILRPERSDLIDMDGEHFSVAQ